MQRNNNRMLGRISDRPTRIGTIAFAGTLLHAALAIGASPSYPTNGDPTNQIRFHTPAQADAKRSELVHYIWADGLPTSTLPSVLANAAFPDRDLTGINRELIASVDALDANVSGMDFHSISYLLHPANTANANRLVIVHQGHVSPHTTMIGGVGETTNRLLQEGYSVLAMQMPLCGWNTDGTIALPTGVVTISSQGSSAPHDEMFPKLTPLLPDGAVFRFFLEPVVQGINHAQKVNPALTDISMIGLSGGAWTTHMASAIDTRIRLSVPVAGSAPLYVRSENGWLADAEQVYSPLFDEQIAADGTGGGVVTWLEIYALGAYGDGRRQIMVTNELEPAGLFPGRFADSFKEIVASVVTEDLKKGTWEHVLDSSTTEHQISPWTWDHVIRPALAVPEPRVTVLGMTALPCLGLGLYLGFRQGY